MLDFPYEGALQNHLQAQLGFSRLVHIYMTPISHADAKLIIFFLIIIIILLLLTQHFGASKTSVKPTSERFFFLFLPPGKAFFAI